MVIAVFMVGVAAAVFLAADSAIEREVEQRVESHRVTVTAVAALRPTTVTVRRVVRVPSPRATRTTTTTFTTTHPSTITPTTTLPPVTTPPVTTPPPPVPPPVPPIPPVPPPPQGPLRELLCGGPLPPPFCPRAERVGLLAAVVGWLV